MLYSWRGFLGCIKGADPSTDGVTVVPKVASDACCQVTRLPVKGLSNSGLPMLHDGRSKTRGSASCDLQGPVEYRLLFCCRRILGMHYHDDTTPLSEWNQRVGMERQLSAITPD
jgi:hypothetical protein